ncbi:hypothetical protein [Salinibacterium sp.]|uniref:hypothetical protein n=1 Tax=Salinibacterium sp. TaxID=1915057 RepID=UPI00286A37B7|nr:hypothetical protein [Salinibacterium sp.]
MYGALWRMLPGPWWARVAVLLLLVAAVAVALVFWVFPWADHFITPQEVTVEQP